MKLTQPSVCFRIGFALRGRTFSQNFRTLKFSAFNFGGLQLFFFLYVVFPYLRHSPYISGNKVAGWRICQLRWPAKKTDFNETVAYSTWLLFLRHANTTVFTGICTSALIKFYNFLTRRLLKLIEKNDSG